MNPPILIPAHFTIEEVMIRLFRAQEWREIFTRMGRLRSREAWQHTYCLYINSRAWRRKRAERREIDNHRCTTPLCFRVDRLEVHHRTYRNIGDEDVENDLVTLCERCHAKEHGLKRDGSTLIELPHEIPDYNDR